MNCAVCHKPIEDDFIQETEYARLDGQERCETKAYHFRCYAKKVFSS